MQQRLPNDRNELFSKNESFQDGDLTFIVHTFRDAEKLAAMLDELRRFYPVSRVIVCSDGDSDVQLPEIARHADAEFYLGENLYAFGNGGKVCQRMLELFTQRPSRYLFKVDPDTGFHRRFAFVPEQDGMFGTLQSNPMLCSIQGGCMGMTLNVATRMFESGIFCDESLRNAAITWAVHPPLWRYIKKVSRVSSDWIFGYAATQLGIPQFGFSEVSSKWKAAVPNPNLRYAITHPVR